MSVIAAVIVLHTAYKASSDLVKWLQAGKRIAMVLLLLGV